MRLLRHKKQWTVNLTKLSKRIMYHAILYALTHSKFDEMEKRNDSPSQRARTRSQWKRWIRKCNRCENWNWNYVYCENESTINGLWARKWERHDGVEDDDEKKNEIVFDTRTQQLVMCSDFMLWNVCCCYCSIGWWWNFPILASRGHTIAQNFKDFSIRLLFAVQ